MIDSTFIQKVVDLAPPTTIVVEDADGVKRTYSDKELFEVKPSPLGPRLPEPAKVSVSTLEGFISLIIEVGIEDIKESKDDYYIHVIDHENVGFFCKEADEHGRRLELIHATPVKFDKYPFAKWLDQEQFIVSVSAMFAQTDDKDYVLRIASCLTQEAGSVSEDDGFSQRVTIKQGMKQLEQAILRPQVQLAPFRTFPDVGQPVSPFVFRANDNKELALFEADGGKWKIDAIGIISRYLKQSAVGVDIVA